MAEINNQRDEILARLASGRWCSPTTAERVAERLGLPPLSPEPDASVCDPGGEAYWTTLMTLAWIIWRDFEAVRVFSPAYAAERQTWQRIRVSVGQGWVLEQASKPSLRGLTSMVALGNEGLYDLVPQVASVSNAIDLLVSACADGEVSAVGLSDHGKIAEIPRHEWSFLTISNNLEDDGAPVITASGAPTYRDARFSRPAVMEEWKPSAGASTLSKAKDQSPPPSIVRTNPSKAAGTSFLQVKVRRWTDAGRNPADRPTQREFIAEALETYPGSTHTFWRKVWKETDLPAEFRHRGRRRSSNPRN